MAPVTMHTGLASHARCAAGASARELRQSVHVVRHGWHTGILVRRDAWPRTDWPLLKDFPQAGYLEFGWGDERYYRTERKTLWLALRAFVWPTRSVMHVVGVRGSPREELPRREFIEVPLSEAGLAAMARAIEASFGDDDSMSTVPLALGRYGDSRFYRANRRFHFPRTCNWWTARMLESGGCPLRAWRIVTARQLMRAARNFGVELPSH